MLTSLFLQYPDSTGNRIGYLYSPLTSAGSISPCSKVLKFQTSVGIILNISDILQDFFDSANFYLPAKAYPPRITVSSPIVIDEGEDLALAKSPIFRHSSSLNSAIVEKYCPPTSSPPMK